MGYGLVEETAEGIPFAMAWGVHSVKPQLSIGKRLHDLYNELLELIKKYKPSEVAVEEPFVSLNAKTALSIGQAQGVVLIAAAATGLPVHRYSPLQVKQAATGHGGASKRQMQLAIQMHLGLSGTPAREDAADALAVALCHLQARRTTTMLHGKS